MNGGRVKVHQFVTGAFQENCYVLSDEVTGDAVVVDPGADGEALVSAIRALGVRPLAIWLTHAHLDHIGAVGEITDAWEVPVYLHPADLPLYRAAERQAAAFGLPFRQPPDPDTEFREGDEVRLGGSRFTVMHAPGHAPGHVVLHGEGIALVGDCLFAGSVGRTDLPLSNGADLERTLVRIAALPDETRVLSGHGPETTIGRERRSNPYLMGLPLGRSR